MTEPKPRVRVAILGGGCGAMAAAFGLTATPALRGQYEVTVYQQGWRLGGKGASGRNAAAAERIEEHGLHAFMGFYENAFTLMRACYAEWQKAPDNPFQSWTDAFKPQRLITLEEWVGGTWETWNIDVPPLPGEPGDGGAAWSWAEYFEKLIGWLVGLAEGAEAELRARKVQTGSVPVAHGLLHSVSGLFSKIVLDVEAHGAALAQIASSRGHLRTALESVGDAHPVLRRLWLLLDIGHAVAIGLLRDVLPPFGKGFAAIDNVELRAWLASHGASSEAVESAPIRALYDLGFAYVGGDSASLKSAQIAAGVGVKVMLRIVFGYKDAPLWKMQAGMGDTVFSPLYEVLSARGVRFEFFHRVQKLALSPDRSQVAAIELSRQVDLMVPAYAPLVNVKGLPCWPSEPRWEQVRDGKALHDAGVNLESAWCTHEVARRTLVQGRDFDRVVLGISVAALAGITSELQAASPEWGDMLGKTVTVQTQAVQLWLTPPLDALGWTAGTTVMTSYVEPLDSWGEMSHLIPREAWPAGHEPANIAYFCGALRDGSPDPLGDPTYPAKQLGLVKESARQWLDANVGQLWPKATRVDNPNGLDWSKLVDLSNQVGVARLGAQYFRANVDPTERYVLSVPGSIAYRLRADGSGFGNLYLAGDWVRTSINGGSAEAAVEAGFRASKAICGYPDTIAGEL